MTERLFVYGTLAPGQPNEHVLADLDGTWEPAAVHGWLFASGVGEALGYPGVVLDEQAPEVPGLLFSSDELSRHWSRVDEFEGGGYDRVTTTVLLAGGSTVVGHIYVLHHDATPSSPS